MVLSFGTENEVMPEFSDPPAPGNYHVAIVEIDEEGGDSGEMLVETEVLAGTIKGMEGRTKTLKFRNEMKHVKYFHQLAVVLGLITTEELDKKNKAGEAVEYDFSGKGPGRQMMIRVVEEKYKDKDENEQIANKVRPWDFWAVDDPSCQNWPKNEKMLKKAGYEVKTAEKKPESKSSNSPSLDDLDI